MVQVCHLLRLPFPSVLVLGAVLSCGPALAQVTGGFSVPTQPVVQSLPSGDSMTLNGALARLGRDPRDLQALIDAGQAALSIGDVDAAIGFYSRAEQVMPGTPRVKAGLARALVRSGNPFDALPLFDEAERGGTTDSAIALDRGLAYDLVADNASAQRYYRLALAGGQNDEATRRLAISLAIAGDKRSSSSVIAPLLQRQDKASWRTRAFALAILGQADEAISVINATLPAPLAGGIAPYLRYMPRLTPAQQAAAANFGQFPRASEIGQDDPRVSLYAPAGSRRTTLAAGDAALIPRGEPLGRNQRGRDSRTSSRERGQNGDRQRPPEVAIARPAPVPVPQQTVVQPAALPRQPQLAVATVAARPAAPPLSAPISAQPMGQRTPAPPATAATVLLRPTPVPAQPVRPYAPPAAAITTVQPAPRVTPALASATAPPVITAPARPAVLATAAPPLQPPPLRAPVPIAAPVTQPTRPAPPVPPAPRRVSLAEAFSDLSLGKTDVSPSSGAVDIRRIRPAREPAAGNAAPGPAVPSHPSRIWVQLATGRDRTALTYDWRRMARQADTVFKNRRPSISAWGQTNRLLTGPFDSEAAANAFLAQLRRADIEGSFAWTSPAGQVVDALALR